jgi:hypothetical protein
MICVIDFEVLGLGYLFGLAATWHHVLRRNKDTFRWENIIEIDQLISKSELSGPTL